MSTDVERIKQASRGLRGTLSESLVDPLTGAIRADDTTLSKFHGIYQQDDRDLRLERQRQKLEPAFQFMIRARVPGGICTTEQWLAMTRISREISDGTLRLTTRQAFQWHGVLKAGLKPLIQTIDSVLMDTLAACGDVNRNVMASPNPHRSKLHAKLHEVTLSLSQHLTPRTGAYHEIWLDGEKLARDEPEEEPIYGPAYLPRKFKISLAIPPDNDVDVFAQDLGFIGIVEDEELIGFNVTVGGGMGATHGDPQTYPRLADVIGFCRPEDVNHVAEHVVGVQRDFGNREVRKRARMKYTIDDRGLDWFVAELNSRLREPLAPARSFRFGRHTDRYGWVEGDDGLWHHTVYVQNGRLHADQLDALEGIATALPDVSWILTPNQNLAVANVPADGRAIVEAQLEAAGLMGSVTPLRAASIACVSMPTCGLGMAEAERYLPTLVDHLEAVFAEAGVPESDTVIRMTGCPNGCARPYVAEIGFVGKAPGRYNVHLGGDGRGQALNTLWAENRDEAEILDGLRPVIERWAAERENGERFGTWVRRTGIVEEAA
ncbi:MAG: NADPH-dependent assimilatory sulfite reductase hemoprotein subunit [Pseudomonadota bacterium]